MTDYNNHKTLKRLVLEPIIGQANNQSAPITNDMFIVVSMIWYK